MAANHLKTQRHLADKNNSQLIQTYLEDRADPEEAVNLELARTLKRGKLVDRVSSKHFVQSHIWDKILEETRVEMAISKKYVVAVDTFNGAITELLSKNLFKTGKDQLFWIEIYIVQVGKPTDPFAPSLIIRFEDLELYELLVKMKMIESQVTQNDKMSLKKVFEIFALSNRIDVENQGTEPYLVTQSKLHDIAYFVSQRMFKFSADLSISADSSNLLVENGLSKQYFFRDRYESKMKLNSRIVGLAYRELGSPNRAYLSEFQPDFAVQQSDYPAASSDSMYSLPRRRRRRIS